MPVRSSISMRISLNSCSLKPATTPWRSLIVPTFPLWLGMPRNHNASRTRAGNHRLPQSDCRHGPLGLGRNHAFAGAELGQSFVQLVREFDQLTDRGDRAARSLRSLARDVGNNLHSVSDAFRAAHLLFGSQGNFLDEFSGLAHHAGDGVQRATCLIG